MSSEVTRAVLRVQNNSSEQVSLVVDGVESCFVGSNANTELGHLNSGPHTFEARVGDRVISQISMTLAAAGTYNWAIGTSGNSGKFPRAT